jgi:hypothetical protein
MQRQIASSMPPATGRSADGTRRPVGLRPRALTATQESVFFAVIFALGLCLQLAAVLMQATASG